MKDYRPECGLCFTRINRDSPQRKAWGMWVHEHCFTAMTPIERQQISRTLNRTLIGNKVVE